MKGLHTITFILLVIGGINWGLVGTIDYNAVETLLGAWPLVVQVVYVLVGLSAIIEVATHKKTCKDCAAA